MRKGWHSHRTPTKGTIRETKRKAEKKGPRRKEENYKETQKTGATLNL